MLLIKTYTAPDTFGGTGLFASESINVGVPIWRYHPDIDVFYAYEVYKALPTVLRQTICKHVYPAILGNIAGVMYSRDDDRFTNHSFSPNTGEIGGGFVGALQDIRAGEEITANYFEFIPAGLPDFYVELPSYGFLLTSSVQAASRLRRSGGARSMR